MLFKSNLISQTNVFYFPKHSNVSMQDGMLCYYEAYLHLFAMYGITNAVSPAVLDIVNSLNKVKANTQIDCMKKKLIEHADDLLWIIDEIADKKSLEEAQDEDEDEDYLETFLDTYGVDLALAKLLELSVKEFNLEKFNPKKLLNILNKDGPLALRLNCYFKLPKENLLIFNEKIQAEKKIKNVFQVHTSNIGHVPHCVLIIGCKMSRHPKIYLVDPVYPDLILSINFDLAKKHILTPEYVTLNDQNKKLKPDQIIFHARAKEEKINKKMHL